MPAEKIDLQKFLTDPAFQGDRDLLNGVIDARLKAIAEEQKKAREQQQSEKTFLQRLFDGE